MTPQDPADRNGAEDSGEPLVNWKKLEQWLDKNRPDDLPIPWLVKIGKALNIFSFRYISRAFLRCASKDMRSFLGRYRAKIQAKDESGNPVGKLPYQSVPNPNPEGDYATSRVYKRSIDNPKEYVDRIMYWRHHAIYSIHQLSQNERYGLEDCGTDLLTLIGPEIWEKIHRLIDIAQDGRDEPPDGPEPPAGPLPPWLDGGPPRIG